MAESDDFETAIAMYAVAAGTRRDPAPYAAQIEKLLGTPGRPALEFLDTVRRGGDPQQAAAALPAFDLRLRLHLLNAAVIMLGRDAPAQWRTYASRGLFVGERGYLQRL